MHGSVDLVREICELLAVELERDVAEVTPSKQLVEDLGADSVALLAVVETLVRRYPVEVQIQTMVKEARAQEVATVADLCVVVDEMLRRFSCGEARA